MGNKKKGFTLPELLITMGILGVMAALLIPHVVKNIEKNKSGAILGKAVAQIELGCQNMIQKANESMEGGSYIQTLGLIRVNDLYPDTKSYALVISPLTFSNYIMPYWGVKKITTNDGQNIKITDYYGDELSSGTGNWLFDLILDLFKNTYRYEFNKFPANVYIPTDIKNYINKNYDDPDEKVVTVYIDTNGFAGPNSFGKDVFVFNLTNAGKLKPYGFESNDHYTETCSDNYIKDGRSCTARVVTENFKINY